MATPRPIINVDAIFEYRFTRTNRDSVAWRFDLNAAAFEIKIRAAA